jgi:hypothetical protein
MKTLTKKQLVEILDQVSDETPVYIYVEIGDVDLARCHVPAGVPLLRLGLPGDHSHVGGQRMTRIRREIKTATRVY